jgi:hypothetical protein
MNMNMCVLHQREYPVAMKCLECELYPERLIPPSMRHSDAVGYMNWTHVLSIKSEPKFAADGRSSL